MVKWSPALSSRGGLHGCPVGRCTGKSWKLGHGGASAPCPGSPWISMQGWGRGSSERQDFTENELGRHCRHQGTLAGICWHPKRSFSSFCPGAGHSSSCVVDNHLGLNPGCSTSQLHGHGHVTSPVCVWRSLDVSALKLVMTPVPAPWSGGWEG